MILVRPIKAYLDQDRIRALFVRNVDDLNWAPSEAHWRANIAATTAALGVKAIIAAELNENNGRCVGVAILTRGDHQSTKHAASLRVLVDREHRGKGLGSSLVEAALERAQAEGIERVEATPYSDADYVTFWERAGFKYEGRRRKAARRVGTGELVSVDVWAWTS